jgi:signal transduction histidine kinase
VLAIVIPAVFMAIGLFVVGASTHQGLVSLAATFLPQIAVLFLAVTLGEVVRGRRALAAETAQRLQMAQEEREAEAARRVAEERLRIARDLHDTVAHSMATITVQAGSALHLLDGGDTNLRRALAAIRATSKEVLAEMRATLGQLRSETSGDPPTLAGGLDRLPALCDAVTAAGAPVTVEVEGEQRPLPPAVDQAAYRILQESLTNVLRHAGQAARATVSLRYEPAALAIRVTDDGGQATGDSGQATDEGGPGTDEGGPGTDGGGPPDPARPAGDGAQPARGGHGLTGMAERAAAVGGKVTAGLRPEGGFEVAAWLPLAAGGDRK